MSTSSLQTAIFLNEARAETLTNELTDIVGGASVINES